MRRAGLVLNNVLLTKKFDTLLKEKKDGQVPRSRKANLEKVQASLDRRCPKCSTSITTAQVKRVDFDRVECPECGHKVPARGEIGVPAD
jgi:predicted RNA-binding Zn-ribbon protein involved in translation (DUF1610 family)